MAPTTGMMMMDLSRGYSRRQQMEFYIKDRAPKMMQTLVRTRRQLPGLGAAVLYGLCSTSMAFLNKAILTTFQFDYPFSILVLQMICTILLLEILNKLKIMDLPKLRFHQYTSFLIPSVCCAMNAALALYALGRMNIPMYGVLKRCTPVVSLVLAYFMLKKGLPSRSVVIAVLMMTGGCFVGGSGDLTFNLTAYLCGALSNVTQALYLTLVQLHSDKRTTAETLYINSVNTLPFLVVLCFLNGEPSGVIHYPNLHQPVFILFLFLVAISGSLLNFSMVLCTSMNSALTTTVVGMFKTIAQTTIGFFAFGGVQITVMLTVGVTMNLSGGILYALAKYRESLKSSVLPLSSKDLMKGSNEDLHKMDLVYNGVIGNHHRANGYAHSHGQGPIMVNSVYIAPGSTSRERKPSESQDDVVDTEHSHAHDKLATIIDNR